jgi:uncharacterized protein involved in exopolysaccharide biosynthesis
MDESRSVSLRDNLNVIFKNKFFILGLFIAAMFSSFFYCILASPVYVSKTQILVQVGREKLSSIDAMPKESYNIVFRKRTQDIYNEVELLKSTYLIKKIFPRLKRMLIDVNKQYLPQASLLKRIRIRVNEVNGKVKKCIRNLLVKTGLTSQLSEDQLLLLRFNKAKQIEFIEDSDVIEIRFRWDDPGFAADALNLYAEAYLQEYAEIHKTNTSLNFYYDQIDKYKTKLGNIEKELVEYKVNNNISDINGQRKTLIAEVADIENTLRKLQIKQREINIKLKQINRMDKTPGEWIETPNIGQLGKKLTDLSNLDQAYFSLKTKRDAISQVYLASSKKVEILNTQMDLIKHQKANSLFNILNTERNVLSNQEIYLSNELNKKRLKLDKLNIQEMNIEQLNRERDISRDNFLLYSKKGEELRISKELDKNKIFSVKIMEPALPPIIPESPKKWLILGLTAFLSLFIGFAYSVVHEYFNHTFEDANDFDRHLNIPLLLTVPKSKYLKR